LEATNWVLGGWDGAAARLGLSRTTLISRMQRLGISSGTDLRKSARQPVLSGVEKRARVQPNVAG
jgi:formate hydrogenlyase transcriptional activator